MEQKPKRSLFGYFEQKLGLPKVSEIGDVLKNMPDERQLKLLRSILADVEKIKSSPEELVTVMSVIQLIAQVDMERLMAVKGITGDLVKLAKVLPLADLLKQLPVKEVVAEVKKAINEK
jgi:hypothetical protein